MAPARGVLIEDAPHVLTVDIGHRADMPEDFVRRPAAGDGCGREPSGREGSIDRLDVRRRRGERADERPRGGVGIYYGTEW